MNRIDKLIEKVKPSSALDRLEIDNPYIGKRFEELTDYLSGDNYRALEMRTWEWTQFMHVMMTAPSYGWCDDMEVCCGESDKAYLDNVNKAGR